MNQFIPAEFHGTPLSIIDHAGKKWLTAEEIGKCLGYAEANARQGVNNLFKRHEDEFSKSDTFVINLMTNSRGNPNTRIFSDTGCIKLGFFASTPRAKDFRTWASKELAARQTEIVAAPPDAGLASLTAHMGQLAEGMKIVLTQMDMTRRYIGLLEINQQGRVRVTPQIKKQCLLYKGEGMNNADIARLLRVSRTTVSLIVNDKYPDTQVDDEAPSMAGQLDAWIEREQARLGHTLAELKGGAA